MRTPPSAHCCAGRSRKATPARCRPCSRRSPRRAASTTASPAPTTTPRRPRPRSTASRTARTWPPCAGWRATPSAATAEAFREEPPHHPLRALGRQRVVDATGRAVGFRQREAMHGAAEVDELPVHAGRVHLLLETGDVAGGSAV